MAGNLVAKFMVTQIGAIAGAGSIPGTSPMSPISGVTVRLDPADLPPGVNSPGPVELPIYAEGAAQFFEVGQVYQFAITPAVPSA